MFERADPARLAAWRPECIAGFLDQVEDCAVAPSHAVVVFTVRNRCLTPDDRDRLWFRFGVPVFEQIVDFDGRLLASECEGHDGLHLRCGLDDAPPGALRTGRCPCGANTVRVFPIPVPDHFSVRAAVRDPGHARGAAFK